MNKPRFIILAGMILAAAASRLIPHPPNFTPIAAIALFGGAQFSSKRAAFLVPLAGLFLSDLVFGFYAITPVVYGSFMLTVCLGFWVRHRRSVQRIAIRRRRERDFIFRADEFRRLGDGQFVSENSRRIGGLLCCRHPFFRNMLLANVLYSALLFGGFCPRGKSFCPVARTRSGCRLMRP